jgi:hypothetical protein
MMCIAMDPEDFKEDELPTDEFEDLSVPEYKLLTQDEASDDKEEESKDESSEGSAAIRHEMFKTMFTKEDNDEYEEYPSNDQGRVMEPDEGDDDNGENNIVVIQDEENDEEQKEEEDLGNDNIENNKNNVPNPNPVIVEEEKE